MRTTLERYDGSLDVGRGAPGFAKSVTVRLFRAGGDESERASGILAA